MKHIIIVLSLLLSANAFAQRQKTDKALDLKLIKETIQEEYAGDDLKTLDKWILYGLPEGQTKSTSIHKPAMVFLLSGDNIVEQFYMVFVDDFGQYAYSHCDCCHLEKGWWGTLHAHCEEVCTKPPFSHKRQLEKFSDDMKDILVLWERTSDE